MQKVIKGISIVIVSIGFAYVLSLQVPKFAGFAVFQMYLPALVMLFIGGIGLKICDRWNSFCKSLYAGYYSIVNNIYTTFGNDVESKEYKRYSTFKERFEILYDEGLFKYESKHVA